MLGALFTTGCANMMLFFATQSFSGWMVESMIRVASDTVFVTSMRGCLSDVLKGPELTVSAARVATYAGIGICVGPILASRVIMPLISRRYTFVMNACLFWLLTGWVAAKLPETLPPEDRKPMDWTAANPFNFIAMMRRSSILFCAPPPEPRSRQPPAATMRQRHPAQRPNPEPPGVSQQA